jgi:hypothetical protein
MANQIGNYGNVAVPENGYPSQANLEGGLDGRPASEQTPASILQEITGELLGSSPAESETSAPSGLNSVENDIASIFSQETSLEDSLKQQILGANAPGLDSLETATQADQVPENLAQEQAAITNPEDPKQTGAEAAPSLDQGDLKKELSQAEQNVQANLKLEQEGTQRSQNPENPVDRSYYLKVIEEVKQQQAKLAQSGIGSAQDQSDLAKLSEAIQKLEQDIHAGKKLNRNELSLVQKEFALKQKVVKYAKLANTIGGGGPRYDERIQETKGNLGAD